MQVDYTQFLKQPKSEPPAKEKQYAMSDVLMSSDDEAKDQHGLEDDEDENIDDFINQVKNMQGNNLP